MIIQGLSIDCPGALALARGGAASLGFQRGDFAAVEPAVEANLMAMAMAYNWLLLRSGIRTHENDHSSLVSFFFTLYSSKHLLRLYLESLEFFFGILFTF